MIFLFSCFSTIVNSAGNNDYMVKISDYQGKFLETEIDGQYYIAIPIKDLNKVHFSRVNHYIGGGDTPNKCAVKSVCFKCCAGDKEIPKKYCKDKYPNQKKGECNCE